MKLIDAILDNLGDRGLGIDDLKYNDPEVYNEMRDSLIALVRPSGKVTIMRGVSGSGKSTRAWELCKEQGGIIVSADHYFEDEEGNYNFNPRDIGKAHAYCMHRFLQLLQLGEPHIIVDNTNTQNWEFYNYEAAAELAGYAVVFEELPCRDLDDVKLFAERNKHGVPFEAVKAMFERWEER